MICAVHFKCTYICFKWLMCLLWCIKICVWSYFSHIYPTEQSGETSAPIYTSKYYESVSVVMTCMIFILFYFKI